ncbi:hypothetical protein RvY_06882-1, partial [Ramazzottius varieornatus]
MDLRRWALTANETVNLAGFTASPDWIGKLKRYYGIVDRKITKFIIKKSIQEAPHVKESTEACVALVRSRIAEYGLDCLWNADQSGFEYEMRPGRTLETAGVKHVEAITQSENSMTHSYTVMMAVSPGRRKFPVLFLTLKEEKGVFGPIVSRTMFKADNRYVTASTSGKMTKKLYLQWSEKVLFPHMEERCIFLADAWKTFTDQDSVIELKPEELEYEMLTTPPKVTGQIQPLDVLCFRMYKGCFKKISDFVFLHDLPVQVHHRDVILRLHALLYQQFQSPRFENLIAEAWHKSGYTDERFMYVNPAKFMFDKLKGSCLHENCRDIVLLVGGWCKARLCFHHFYD